MYPRWLARRSGAGGAAFNLATCKLWTGFGGATGVVFESMEAVETMAIGIDLFGAVRLTNAYIYADGFEWGSLLGTEWQGNWGGGSS